MTLQESFMERNDLKKKIQRTWTELQTVIIFQEGSEVQFDAVKKLEELKILHNELFDLNVKIDTANRVNIEKLQKLKYLDEEIVTYTNIMTALLSWKKHGTIGYSDEVVVQIKAFDFNEIKTELERLENERRKTDKELQKSNWQTEI